MQLINTAPRVEAQITYNGGIGDLGINLWVDGTYQNTERTEAEAAARTQPVWCRCNAAVVDTTVQ